jgi:hypothetical protein
MSHQLASEFVPGFKDHREDPSVKTAVSDGLLYTAGHDLRRCGMCGVSLCDHRIPRRKSGCRVPTRDRKREGKIARAKDRDGSNGPQAGSHIGLRNGLAIVCRAIDAGIDPRAVLDQVCEQPELKAGPPCLPANPGFGERRLIRDRLDKQVDGGVQPVCNGPKQAGTVPTRGNRETPEGSVSKFDGFVNLLARSREKIKIDGCVRAGVDGLKGRPADRPASSSEKRSSVEFHLAFLLVNQLWAVGEAGSNQGQFVCQLVSCEFQSGRSHIYGPHFDFHLHKLDELHQFGNGI